MRKKRHVSFTLAIILILLMVACSNNRTSQDQDKGIDIVGTWKGQSSDGKYALEITVTSVDYTYGHESAFANVTFTYDKLNDNMRGTTRETIKLSGSDLTFKYEKYYGYANIGFKYGRAVSDSVGVRFYSDGTAEFHVVSASDAYAHIRLTRQ